jgi:hypothetical protein
MTVPLRDVACLWGLPIDNIPVIGISDDDWTLLMEAFFGRQIDASVWVSKKKVLEIW